jgi:3-methyladenine DNA glycosylase AlkD
MFYNLIGVLDPRSGPLGDMILSSNSVLPHIHSRQDESMKAHEARDLGNCISTLLQSEQIEEAYTLLAPVLARRTPFAMLRRIGAEASRDQPQSLNNFLERIATDKTEGGWVVISGVLSAQLDHDLSASLNRCRDFIVAADIWYAADTFGEWVVGRALETRFQPALALLSPWREDSNPWVRRATGTAVHYWAKRSRGTEGLAPQAEILLAFLEPLFEERVIEAVKGVGWGLKTLGKYYPELLTRWLIQQAVRLQRPHRELMLRKALTYLSDEQRARATGGET